MSLLPSRMALPDDITGLGELVVPWTDKGLDALARDLRDFERFDYSPKAPNAELDRAVERLASIAVQHITALTKGAAPAPVAHVFKVGDLVTILEPANCAESLTSALVGQTGRVTCVSFGSVHVKVGGESFAWSYLPKQLAPASSPPERDADGWIKWEGGECPVPGGTRIVVEFRDKELIGGEFAANWTWDHGLDAGDIIAYKIVSPQ